MPRVSSRRKSTAGKELHCQRCGEKILPGEVYYKWTFRHAGSRTNCYRHPPRPSELTLSKLATIYAAQEEFSDAIGNATTLDEVRELVEAVASTAQEVKDEYEEAAEAMGAAGESGISRERADELEGYVSELENFDPDVEEFDEDEARSESEVEITREWLDEAGKDYTDEALADPMGRHELLMQHDFDMGDKYERAIAQRIEEKRASHDEDHDGIEAVREAATEAVDALTL